MTSLIERAAEYRPTLRDRTEEAVFSAWRQIEALRDLPGIGHHKAQLADMRDTLDEIVRSANG